MHMKYYFIYCYSCFLEENILDADIQPVKDSGNMKLFIPFHYLVKLDAEIQPIEHYGNILPPSPPLVGYQCPMFLVANIHYKVSKI